MPVVDEMHDTFGIVAGEDQAILRNGLRQGSRACLVRNVQFASADEADCFLNGCAARPPLSDMNCPEPLSIPAHLAECAGLLARGAELLERGASLAQAVVADKDAVVRMTK